MLKKKQVSVQPKTKKKILYKFAQPAHSFTSPPPPASRFLLYTEQTTFFPKIMKYVAQRCYIFHNNLAWPQLQCYIHFSSPSLFILRSFTSPIRNLFIVLSLFFTSSYNKVTCVVYSDVEILMKVRCRYLFMIFISQNFLRPLF